MKVESGAQGFNCLIQPLHAMKTRPGFFQSALVSNWGAAAHCKTPYAEAEMFGLDSTSIKVKARDLDSVDATSQLTLKMVYKVRRGAS